MGCGTPRISQAFRLAASHDPIMMKAISHPIRDAVGRQRTWEGGAKHHSPSVAHGIILRLLLQLLLPFLVAHRPRDHSSPGHWCLWFRGRRRFSPRGPIRPHTTHRACLCTTGGCPWHVRTEIGTMRADGTESGMHQRWLSVHQRSNSKCETSTMALAAPAPIVPPRLRTHAARKRPRRPRAARLELVPHPGRRGPPQPCRDDRAACRGTCTAAQARGALSCALLGSGEASPRGLATSCVGCR